MILPTVTLCKVATQSSSISYTHDGVCILNLYISVLNFEDSSANSVFCVFNIKQACQADVFV